MVDLSTNDHHPYSNPYSKRTFAFAQFTVRVREGKDVYYASWVGVQKSKKWLVRGLVKFATAVARLVCPDLLG